jgi:hypothetical protein
MGTRSITVVKNNDDKEIVVMYRQYDGYPSGHGLELAEFLADYKICNGFGSAQSKGKWANGMDCLAGQIIVHFKSYSMLGGIYLHPAGTRQVDEEYTYFVYTDNGKVCISIYANTWIGDNKPDELNLVTKGTAAEVLAWIKSPDRKE